MREGLPLPAKIQNAPELMIGLQFYMMAFQQLNSDRGVAPDGRELPIPWSSIDRWADSHDIVGELKEDLHYHVRALDVAYLEYKESKRPKKLPKGAKAK